MFSSPLAFHCTILLTPLLNASDIKSMSSSREEGWLETKIGRAELWERMWVVFDDGVLYYSADRNADRDIDDNVTRVPMDRVISLRTDVSAH